MPKSWLCCREDLHQLPCRLLHFGLSTGMSDKVWRGCAKSFFNVDGVIHVVLKPARQNIPLFHGYTVNLPAGTGTHKVLARLVTKLSTRKKKTFPSIYFEL